MKLSAYIVRTLRRTPLGGCSYASCDDVGKLLDVGIPAMLRRATCGIQVLHRVLAEDVNTWDAYTIIGEQHFRYGGTSPIWYEAVDGFAFKYIKKLQARGPDVHIYAYQHCSLESFGIKEVA